ncbi:phosphotransferase [Fundidesulfovibrio terrae]|uniref:phosphotransferase n=1 Tax=Fundidesulfovibrio terrae TaxID=2922866 RepID=UPI001FAEE15A
MEDGEGGLWLLEQLGPNQVQRREAMGQVLDGLAGRGLHGLAPYRRTSPGSFVCRDLGHSWQLSPFILGEPLIQPDYLDDSARGDALGAWLAAFRQASDGLALPPGLFPLDLPAYITDLLDRIARAGLSHAGDVQSAANRLAGGASPEISRPAGIDLIQVHARASRLLPALAEFFETYDELLHTLCHGDIHPLNVVWGPSAPNAVIDWEFCGIRPEIYDLANCLGCLAIEGDGGLSTPFAQAVLARTLPAGLFSPESARMLAPAILATRFGWLSEWLRRRDEEMITLELDFMEHLSATGNGLLLNA